MTCASVVAISEHSMNTITNPVQMPMRNGKVFRYPYCMPIEADSKVIGLGEKVVISAIGISFAVYLV